MNTYAALLPLSNLFVETADLKTHSLMYYYRVENRVDDVIAYVYCQNHLLFEQQANRFFGLTREDKESFILEEIMKALSNFEDNQGAKLETYVCRYIYNRLRTETEALNTDKRSALDKSTGFEDLGEEDRIEEASVDGSFSYAEMYNLVNDLDLTDNERKCCEVILLNTSVVKNAEIAAVLGISRAGVSHVKKSLQMKLAPVFDMAI